MKSVSCILFSRPEYLMLVWFSGSIWDWVSSGVGFDQELGVAAYINDIIPSDAATVPAAISFFVFDVLCLTRSG